jgi:hypothetical protein
VGTEHSDMCGCKKCSHGARAKPKPRPKPPSQGRTETQGRGEEEGREEEEVGGKWDGRMGDWKGSGMGGSGIWGLFRRRLAGG